ncbi:TIGR02300 family protein [Prosthecodimorpha staleyi]|uniref:TIGR02300 family protein n=1 Tax=Prosthecodimorpha staleyi TaxID=2840188 RepID=A0A947D6E2_9HYPH|nr:TIGR02300 family protein [Prosthecodimorpha staleyi]MBT9291751.1 TIGR02300 family protein [Prosthecodimorpha staleyi]
MAKPELGTKRLCPNCGTKYYDLNRDPILCPKCGTLFTVAAVVSRAKAAPAVEEAEEEVDEAAPIEFVPLEEAEADESADEAVPGIEDEEIADIPDDEDDTFLEAEEDDEIDGIDIDVAGEDEER